MLGNRPVPSDPRNGFSPSASPHPVSRPTVHSPPLRYPYSAQGMSCRFVSSAVNLTNGCGCPERFGRHPNGNNDVPPAHAPPPPPSGRIIRGTRAVTAVTAVIRPCFPRPTGRFFFLIFTRHGVRGFGEDSTRNSRRSPAARVFGSVVFFSISVTYPVNGSQLYYTSETTSERFERNPPTVRGRPA